ncbi:MAG TPA: M81 family metallopeptidase [Dongiaceae bacterium]|nr:M81 family metallopeptidase [Dongiaceae bacterium]
MARIAIGGFQHETNTFAPAKARYQDFVTGGGWPGLTRGPRLFDDVAGINLSIAGFIEAARAAGHELVPLLWCNAVPSAPVERDAYERIAHDLLADLSAAGRIDALYLDLHGAMVAEHLEDGEGELLRRVRGIVGPQLPVVASLDLHANVTEAMVEAATMLIACRTYPHVDLAETGARAARELARILSTGTVPHKALRKLPFLIPLTWQCTLAEPAMTIYRHLAELEEGDVRCLSFTPGFPLADIGECGPAVIAYGATAKAAATAADHLAEEVRGREADFAGRLYDPDEGVQQALQLVASARKPVVLADTQDNPGAGANSDTVGLLAALVRNGATGAALATLYDPEVAAIAHRAGEGATINIGLGAKSGLPGHQPYHAAYRVERLGDGNFTATGPFYRGSRVRLGPMALLSLDGVRIVVASRKQQAADQAIFRHLGIEPAEQKILALKSSVHFRADFQPIAEQILIVAAPGPNLADHRQLAYRRLRPGLRIMPLGPIYRGAIDS